MFVWDFVDVAVEKNKDICICMTSQTSCPYIHIYRSLGHCSFSKTLKVSQSILTEPPPPLTSDLAELANTPPAL
jgi:hypothetical protein